MNKAITEHFPASKLPDEVRQDIDPELSVTVTVLIEDDARTPPTIEQLRDMLDAAQRIAVGVSTDEAVARIRAFRDEWDD